MKRLEHFKPIAHDMGRIFELLGFATCLPFVVLFYYQEWDMFLPMATLPAFFILFGALLSFIPRNEKVSPGISVALVAVALTWFSIALIGSLPFIFGIGMPATDAVFEAMSGWTGTGMSLVVSVDDTPNTLLFLRSYMQWIGGIGIMAFGITMQKRSRMTQIRLFRSEGRDEALMPNVISTAKSLWKIYVSLTVFFTFLILFSGISLWDSLNIVMVAMATGGFSIHDAGISYYDNLMLEILIMPVMFAGSLPFKLYFFVGRGQLSKFYRDRVIQALFFLCLLGSIIATLDLYLFNQLPIEEAARQGVFCAVSGVTNTGLSNSDILSWAAPPVVLLILLMMMSGSTGSTAGGIKINRYILALEGMQWWFKRYFISPRMVTGFKHGGRTFKQKMSELELSRNMLTIILYMIIVFSATVLALHLCQSDFEIHEIVFELVSAASNVGLGVGYMNPASPDSLKWLYIFLMWLGRLEILPVIILAMGISYGFDYRLKV